MIIYSSTKQSFIKDFEQGVLVKKLHQSLTEKYRRVGESEIHSWQTSLSYMANVMRDVAIPNLAGVAIEYIVPNTQKRVDFIITGLDQQDKEHVVIVELKQWSEAFKVTDKDNIVSTYLGGGIRETTHPSYQAWSYCSLIENFNEDVQNRPIELHPCAFLHNFAHFSTNFSTCSPKMQITSISYIYYIVCSTSVNYRQIFYTVFHNCAKLFVCIYKKFNNIIIPFLRFYYFIF